MQSNLSPDEEDLLSPEEELEEDTLMDILGDIFMDSYISQLKTKYVYGQSAPLVE